MPNMTPEELRPKPTDSEQLTVTCGNCYQDKQVGIFSIGKDINQFYKEHRTRIGRTFCSLDAICIRYDILAQRDQQRLSAVKKILHGIDKDEIEDPSGWWETSTGAKFGASKLTDITAALGPQGVSRVQDGVQDGVQDAALGPDNSKIEE